MCNHEKTKSVKATKDVAGLVFAYSTKECVACGSVLWSQSIEGKFQAWLGDQRKENPNKFVVQKVQIARDLAAFATELAEKNHTNESAVFQACLSLYFVLASKRPELSKAIEKIEPGAEHPTAKKFRVNPKLFVKLDANAKAFGLSMNEVASWVIQRVLWAARAGIEATREELEFALAA